jgi:tetratricopeptide (TPR) repeat protein
LAGAEWRLGQSAESDAMLEKARTVRTDLVKQFPAVPEYVIESARCDAEAGDHALRRSQPAAAEEAFRRAVDQVAKVADQYKQVPRYRADLARYQLNLGKALALTGQLEPGRAAIRQALDLCGGLRDDPVIGLEAQVQALDCLHALGDLDRRSGRPEKAIESFDQVLRDAEPLARRTPPVPGAKRQLRDAWWGKADALAQMELYPEALSAWDHAVALSDADNLLFMKLYRLTTLARTSEYEQALNDLDLLAVQARANPQALFVVARVYALAARTAAGDPKLAQADRERRAGEAAERAIDNLRLAQSKGYFADATARDELARNPDLESLRKRPDFQKLQGEVSANHPVSP